MFSIYTVCRHLLRSIIRNEILNSRSLVNANGGKSAADCMVKPNARLLSILVFH